ncbi:MAG TPA: hypothetical protein DDY82_03245 [Clostridiales bacterium]|nr:hypothetical protein [Clostridiales bacterium]HBJ98066.1 hypothetical protein [Clostridiales bacterium]
MKKIYFYILTLLFLVFLLKVLILACNYDLSLNIVRIKNEISAIVKRVKEFKDLFKLLGGICKQLCVKISWIFYNLKSLPVISYVVAIFLYIKKFAFYIRKPNFSFKNYFKFNSIKNISYEKGRLI